RRKPLSRTAGEGGTHRKAMGGRGQQWRKALTRLRPSASATLSRGAGEGCSRHAMIPGELFPGDGDVELNAGRPTVTLTVANTGDRPIQVGSHYHFYETNSALRFDREQARGFRLDI